MDDQIGEYLEVIVTDPQNLLQSVFNGGDKELIYALNEIVKELHDPTRLGFPKGANMREMDDRGNSIMQVYKDKIIVTFCGCQFSSKQVQIMILSVRICRGKVEQLPIYVPTFEPGLVMVR